jgi:hypothetical protein
LPTEVEVIPFNAQPHDRGISAVANELDLDRKAVREAIKIETQVTPEAKEAAREAGVYDNNSAMLQVASFASEEQRAKVEEIAAAKKRKKQRREERLAEKAYWAERWAESDAKGNAFASAAATLILKSVTDEDTSIALVERLVNTLGDDGPERLAWFLIKGIIDANPAAHARLVKYCDEWEYRDPPPLWTEFLDIRERRGMHDDPACVRAAMRAVGASVDIIKNEDEDEDEDEAA